VRALLVDDDTELARLLAEYLSTYGVSLDHAERGTEALEQLAKAPYDVVLLDVMLPELDGFEVCKRIRAESAVPIVMLTARGEDDARVTGLELGADDYVPKPFNPRELLARMRAVLRRAQRPPQAPSPVPAAAAPAPPERIEVGGLVIDLPGHSAALDGRTLPLTSLELRVLAVLARRAGQTVTREELAGEVLARGEAYDPTVDRSLDVHVSRLRHKLGDDVREPHFIRTVRGIGYVLVKPW
jgi:DNA-binding response OmpR family regulator